MSDPTNRRKFDHITIIETDAETDRNKNYFDAIHLSHRALPEVDLRAIDPSILFLEKRLTLPLIISSMTGGDHEMLRTINRNLATAAEATGVAMAVGSQRVMFTHPAARSSFELRTHAPHTLLLANLGAVQLNYGFDESQTQDAIDILDADGVYFHLNPLQEAIQPEGNTDFSNLAAQIAAQHRRLSKPVLLKEVGSGFSLVDAEIALRHGLHLIDIAGSGGTSWSRIEHARRDESIERSAGLLFQDWGIPTPLALHHLAPLQDRLTLIASGGIRSGLDMAKAIILGAALCGVARPFLKPAMESAQRVIEVIERIRREFIITLFLLGAQNVKQIHHNKTLILNAPFDLTDRQR